MSINNFEDDDYSTDETLDLPDVCISRATILTTRIETIQPQQFNIFLVSYSSFLQIQTVTFLL